MITYNFAFGDGRNYHFEVPLQGWQETPASREESHPAWTLLLNDQCPNCPLDPSTHRFCPAAVDLHSVATKFTTVSSYHRARVTVVVGERTFASECDMNIGLRSLFGLYMALGNCPVTSKMRPMALHHLPFSSMEETLASVVRHYLQKQYFVMKAGGEPDWELKGLSALYESLDMVNSTFIKRVKHASVADSNLNAICGFGTFSKLYVMALDDLLDQEKAVYLEGF